MKRNKEKKKQSRDYTSHIVELKLKKSLVALLVLYATLFLAFIVQLVNAFPQVATEFYGTVTINGKNATLGTIVSVYTKSGTLCGRFTVRNEGKYGFLSCKGDDLDTKTIEGGVHGEEIIFKINGFEADRIGDYIWSPGGFHNVNISIENYIENEINDNDFSKSNLASGHISKSNLVFGPKRSERALEISLLILFILLIVLLIYIANSMFAKMNDKIFGHLKEKVKLKEKKK